MHEFAVADQIFRSCIDTANYHKVDKIIEINLELGDFTLVVEELLTYSFNIVKKQSPITEESELVIIRTPGIIECNDCNEESEIWFNDEQEEVSPEDADEFDKFTQKVHLNKDLRFMSVNLFRCKHCKSRNTNLISGKEIKVKDIKVQA